MEESRYQNGKIYKLVSNVSDKIYIGSTCNTLAKRLAEHKKTHKRFTNGKILNKSSSTELFKLDGEVKIILIEDFPCKSKNELVKRERVHIESNICVNKKIPGRTKAEYYEANREEILKSQKQYYEENSQQILKSQKQYYEVNREEILKSKKQYYEVNREEIEAKGKAPILCPSCNKQMRNDSLAKHIKRKHTELRSNGEAEAGGEAQEQVEEPVLIFID